ncbi:MAG TPA: hypothetical protein VN231_10485 [Allosphingosinicella sp.]|nr:hypothetical protein [Allosphingosinicella sp.]
MTIEFAARRHCRLAALAFGLACAASAAQAQVPPPAPPPSGVAYGEPGAEQPAEAPPARRSRARSEIRPYLEVSQVVSADLDGGDTLTYTSLAAGVDGRVQARRVSVQMSYRYQRNIEWSGEVGDQDAHSGVAMVNAQIAPGVQFDAGAVATRTGGQGRALGVSDRDQSVEVYSAYAGPTVSTQAGPVNVNAAYRIGYVAVDDDLAGAGRSDDHGNAVAHAASASAGMAPGRLPVGWGVNVGYQRTDSDGEFDHEFEGSYVRADVVVPVSPRLAVTAGVGYENIEATQLDMARDEDGVPIVGPDGIRPDPSRPRVLTYDLDGIIYDAGLIWRPSARTEVQARAGHRYGGTTVVASVSHQFSANAGMSASVHDSVQTFGSLLTSDISSLPDNFEVNRDPLTGSLGGCVFGAEPGRGVCLDRSLQSIRGNSFRLRGANVTFSGRRRVWNWGLGADYSHRRYGRPDDAAFDSLGSTTDESFSLFASAGRRLTRTSDLGLSLYASWFDTNQADFDRVFSTGATVDYSRSFLMDRLQLLAALGLYHSDDGVIDSTVASGLLGLRYSF